MMWIRSQDRNKLVNVSAFSVVKVEYVNYEDEFDVRGFEPSCKDDWWVLCTYSTKEKAMKVMDMIQEFIEGQKLMMDVANSSSLIKQYVNSTETKVFQMPQDSEVE